jgi:2-polyprenyl-3-methyl-5-hydroxy-6-metoxy-1,4-benzoquinol methylase
MEGWIDELFIEKGELFLRILDYMWRNAERDVASIISLFKRYDIKQDANIIDVGCGNGRILVNLALKGYKNLFGVDISPIFIEDAKKKMQQYGVSNIKYFVADARDIDKTFQDYRFDVILSVWTTLIGYYDEATNIKIFKNYFSITNNGGIYSF